MRARLAGNLIRAPSIPSTMTDKVMEVLKEVESIEDTWKVTLTDGQDGQHSFGRTKEGKDIGLWSVPPSTGNFLRLLVLATRAKTILELGCSAGYSTLWMSLAARETGGHIYTTEILEKKIALARSHFQKACVTDIITLIEGDLEDTLTNWDTDRIDFVFMDADKRRYATYYEMVLPLMNSGGMLIADNAIGHSQLMESFLKAVASDERVVSHLMDYDNGLMMVYKN